MRGIRIKRWLIAFIIAIFTHTSYAKAPVTIYKHALASRIGPPLISQAKRRTQPPSPRLLYAGTAEITAYTGVDSGQRGDDITASGKIATPYVTVAAWSGIPFGSIVEVPALGRKFIVQDRGGAIGYAHLDLYVGHDNIADAYAFGRKNLAIKIYEPR